MGYSVRFVQIRRRTEGRGRSRSAYLGSIPFDPGIVRGGDDGVHRIVAEPDGVTAKSFVQVVDKVMDIVESGNRTAVNIR